jgi:hypothetical protein
MVKSVIAREVSLSGQLWQGVGKNLPKGSRILHVVVAG